MAWRPGETVPFSSDVLALPEHRLDAAGPLSVALRERGLRSFRAAAGWVQTLPYGRNADRLSPTAVLDEQRGTCSTKHALLKRVADEQGLSAVQLVRGIFWMSPRTHPRIAPCLEGTGLSGIPEAHCYLRVDTTRVDLTVRDAHELELFDEVEIAPDDIGEAKLSAHRRFLDLWRRAHGVPHDLDLLWAIRERCIAALSQPPVATA